METIEYRTIDKSKWGDGPWQDEPDKRQWQDDETGLPCLIVRSRLSGALCGYVGVTEDHPWYREDYGSDGPNSAEVHGGLTFAGPCQPTDDESHDVCHKPAPGEPDHVWWLGFDCAHGFDFTPGRVSWRDYGVPYRDLAYVTSEVTGLARQIAAKAPLP